MLKKKHSIQYSVQLFIHSKRLFIFFSKISYRLNRILQNLFSLFFLSRCLFLICILIVNFSPFFNLTLIFIKRNATPHICNFFLIAPLHVECFFNLQTQKKPFHSLDKRQSKQFLLCSLWKYEMCPPFATLYAPHFFLIYFSISKLLHLKLLFLEKSKTSRFFLARQILVTFSLVLHYFNKRFHV